MKRILILALLAAISIACSASKIEEWFGGNAKAWNADNIKMVHLLDSSKWVCNPDNVIKQATCDSIDLWCSKLNRDKGVESVVVIVNKVENEDCFRMAQDIGNKYGVGNKDTRRGLVIVVAYEQHKYFFATGQGLEQDLPDAECSKIAEDFLKPPMRDNNPDKAMLNSIKAIYNYLDYGVSEVYKGQRDEERTLLIIVIVVIVGVFIILVVATKGEIFEVFCGGSSFGGGSSSSCGSFGGGSFGGGGAGGSW